MSKQSDHGGRGRALRLFFSYAHADEALRDALAVHLHALKREGAIDMWHDREIVASASWAGEIDEALERADVVLLLISSDFIASEYCFDREMTRALERHRRGEARVVPILLRPCDWQTLPFASLQALPKDAVAVTLWPNQDDALLDVATGLRRLIQEIRVERRAAAHGSAPGVTPNDAARLALERALEDAREQRADLERRDLATAAVDQTIAGLKTLLAPRSVVLRDGDQLLGGRFRLRSNLGEGGFAQVWEAYDRERESIVAVKVLHSHLGRDERRQRRFFRGAREMLRLQACDGVVDVFEKHCQDGDHHFFVMERLECDFHQAVRDGALTLEDRFEIVLAVGEALAFAHARGIVHRDVKPANILLDRHNRPKLSDFDLVRAADTQNGTRTAMLGTFLYAAPEALVEAARASKPADVYGLGMTLLFAIHGVDLPAEAHYDRQRFLRSVDVDARVRDVVTKAVEPRIENRWESVEVFCEALRDARTPEIARPSIDPVVSEPESPVRPEAERVVVPLLPHAPAVFDGDRPAWAASWDVDAYGQYAGLRVGGVEQRLRWIGPGTFMMGSPKDEAGRFEKEGPRHQETIDHDFWLGDTPCTQGFWTAVMGENPSGFDGLDRPVEQVSWEDCQRFLASLDAQLGGSWGARLPSEAEWEYACRAGTETATYAGVADAATLDEIAWYQANSGRTTHPVARKQPNGWGMYDMLGNVWEWCADRWCERYGAPRQGTFRVVRGGSWINFAHDVRAAARYRSSPSARNDLLGFRLARGPSRSSR